MVISLNRWKGKVAIVTGASAGIGADLAKQLVESGLIVVGFARRLDRVQALANQLNSKTSSAGKLYPLQCDVKDEQQVLNAFQWIRSNLGPIHILVNNAGCGAATNLVEGSTELWKNVLDTNVLGLCVCTREAVKDMRANGVDGHVVHVNSVQGHRVTHAPTMNVYAASKFAVTALTETLRQELIAAGSRIKITSVSPGIVDTEFRDACGRKPITQEPGPWKDAPQLAAEDVAEAIVYALSTPPHVQIHELTIKPVGEKLLH